MNIKTGNGMGIQTKGIGWKPMNGMELKTQKGMGIKTSNGMGLTKQQSYFKFNEYERKRKYFQMGSHKPSGPRPPKPANQNKTSNKPTKEDNKKVKDEPVKPAESQKPEATTKFPARQKWGAATGAIAAVSAFNSKKKKNNPYEEVKKEQTSSTYSGMQSEGNSVASIKRTMNLFEQMLYV